MTAKDAVPLKESVYHCHSLSLKSIDLKRITKCNLGIVRIGQF